MEIRIQATGQVVTESDFRAMHPNTSGPIAAMMEQFEADPVLEAPAPAVAWNQSAQRNGVVLDALGNWVQAWQVIDWTQEQIDAALAQAHSDKNAQINQWRLEANRSSFQFAGKTIQCDELSRSDIDAVNGVALRGALPATFPGAWKAADNSYVMIPDLATWYAFYDAMVDRGTGNFNRTQELKAQLALADTLPAIQTITW